MERQAFLGTGNFIASIRLRLWMRAGGNFVLNISASPFWARKRELRRDMLATIAKNDRVPVVFVNQVGGNDSLVFDGLQAWSSTARGNVIAQGKSFEEDLGLIRLRHDDRRDA